MVVTPGRFFCLCFKRPLYHYFPPLLQEKLETYYPSYLKLDSVSSLRVSSCVKGQLSAVVDRMIWPFWTSPWQVTRGWSQLECKARWPSRRAPEVLNFSELGPIQCKGCPGAIVQR